MLELLLLLVVLLRTNHLWLETPRTKSKASPNTRRRVKMRDVIIRQNGHWVVQAVPETAIPFLQRRGVLLAESLLSRDSMTLISMANHANMR